VQALYIFGSVARGEAGKGRKKGCRMAILRLLTDATLDWSSRDLLIHIVFGVSPVKNRTHPAG
jgi:hypothetical protein